MSKILSLFSMTFHVSAGHSKHEYTSGYALNEVFKFFFEEDYIKNKLQE
jgi:hypothetical protein